MKETAQPARNNPPTRRTNSLQDLLTILVAQRVPWSTVSRCSDKPPPTPPPLRQTTASPSTQALVETRLPASASDLQCSGKPLPARHRPRRRARPRTPPSGCPSRLLVDRCRRRAAQSTIIRQRARKSARRRSVLRTAVGRISLRC